MLAGPVAVERRDLPGGFLSTRDRCRRGARSHTASFTEWRGLPEVSSRALGLKEEPGGNKEPVDDRAWTKHELCGFSRKDPFTRPRGLFLSAAPATLSAEGAATGISAEGAMLSQPTEGGTRRGAYPGGRSGSGDPNPEEGWPEFYRWGGAGPSPRCSAAESLGGHDAWVRIQVQSFLLVCGQGQQIGTIHKCGLRHLLCSPTSLCDSAYNAHESQGTFETTTQMTSYFSNFSFWSGGISIRGAALAQSRLTRPTSLRCRPGVGSEARGWTPLGEQGQGSSSCWGASACGVGRVTAPSRTVSRASPDEPPVGWRRTASGRPHCPGGGGMLRIGAVSEAPLAICKRVGLREVAHGPPDGRDRPFPIVQPTL